MIKAFQIVILLVLTIGFTAQAQTDETITGAAAGGQQASGLVAPAISTAAPAQTVHWGKLVGNWLAKLDEMTPEGEVSASYEAEWNFVYTLGGLAIQDIFILPPRAGGIPYDRHFYGTGLRLYDAEAGHWTVMWIDTGGKVFEQRAATSTDREIIMTSLPDAQVQKRWVYHDFTPNGFRWREEVRQNGAWVVQQRVQATRQ